LNPALERLTGLVPEKVIGRLITEVYPGLDEWWIEAYGQVVETGEPAHFERWMPQLERWYEVNVFPRGGERFAVLYNDITERKRTEEAAADSEARYRGIVETAEEGIAVHEPDGTITYVNQRMADMLGYSREEIIGRSSLDFVDDDERANVLAAREGLQQEGSFTKERRMRRRDGSALWTLGNLTPRRDGDGNFIGYLAMHTDITARKQAEVALRQSEARFAGVFEKSPLALALTKMPEITTVDVNPAFERLFGFKREELVGKTSPDLGISDPAAQAQVAAQFAEHGYCHDLECVRRTKSGEELWVSLNIDKLEIDGHPYHLTCVQEITERKRTEEALRESEARHRGLFETLQEGLVHPLPVIDGVELAMRSVPARSPERVGGDFCDVFALPDDKVLALIGDVAGKGISAAALAETVRSALRSFALVDDDPGFILRKTNELLLADEAVETFVTAAAVVLDKGSGEARIASAGHPSPVRLGPDLCQLAEPAYGTPLGSFGAQYATTTLLLDHGQSLVLYTDGVTEAGAGGVMFGDEHLLSTLSVVADQPVQDVADALASAARSFSDELKDDLEVLVLRWR
ncbi:MAG TPA: PAS domain S-box protein, partial [Thermoleophilia bacterium]|nr:PAS domain S-box protein [Thermoleophilia bacterium]